MSNARWRREFLIQCGRANVPPMLVSALLRNAPAIQRAAEAECSFIEPIAAPFTKRGEAAERRIVRAVEACNAANGTKFRAEFNGDPRGAVVTLAMPPANPGFRDHEIHVPAEGFSVRAMDWLTARQDRHERRAARVTVA